MRAELDAQFGFPIVALYSSFSVRLICLHLEWWPFVIDDFLAVIHILKGMVRCGKGLGIITG